LEVGPPVGYPVQFRILGPDAAALRRIAGQVGEAMRANPRRAGGDRGRHGTAVPSHPANRRGGDPRVGAVGAVAVLGPDGHRDHGRLVSATLLTLAFVPAVYAAWLGVPAGERVTAAVDAAPIIQDVD
jgi:hypothetical protein